MAMRPLGEGVGLNGGGEYGPSAAPVAAQIPPRSQGTTASATYDNQFSPCKKKREGATHVMHSRAFGRALVPNRFGM
jgi:hypothetical protein